MTYESVDSTKRMRAMAEETRRMGVETVITLNHQGEQLDNVERRLDEINLDLNQTDVDLKELEKCCGCFTCICCAPQDITKTKQYYRAYEDKAYKPVVASQPKGSRGNSNPAVQEPFIKRVTDDDRENEMEDNLQYVISCIHLTSNTPFEVYTDCAFDAIDPYLTNHMLPSV